jgi:hypothetical protein
MKILTPQRLHVAAGLGKDFELLLDYLLEKAELYLIESGNAMRPIDDIQTEVELWLLPNVYNWELVDEKKVNSCDYKTTNVILMVDAISKYQDAFAAGDCREVSRLTYTITSYALAVSDFDHEDFTVEDAESFAQEIKQATRARKIRNRRISESINDTNKHKPETESETLVRKYYNRLVIDGKTCHRDSAAIISQTTMLSASQVRRIYQKLDLKK